MGGLLIAPFLISPAIFIWGWRPTALISGIAIALLVLPLALWVRRCPESMGLPPRGKATTEDQIDLAAEILDHAFRQATAST